MTFHWAYLLGVITGTALSLALVAGVIWYVVEIRKEKISVWWESSQGEQSGPV